MFKHFPGLRSTTWVCSASSTALLLVLTSLALHVRIGLGHWPFPGSEDGGTAEEYNTWVFRAHVVISGVLYLFTVYMAPLVWLVCLFVLPIRLTWPHFLMQAIVYAWAWALIWTAPHWDCTGSAEWLSEYSIYDY